MYWQIKESRDKNFVSPDLKKCVYLIDVIKWRKGTDDVGGRRWCCHYLGPLVPHFSPIVDDDDDGGGGDDDDDGGDDDGSDDDDADGNDAADGNADE